MYWRAVVFVACYYVPAQPYEVELKGAELEWNFRYYHFSSFLTVTRAFMIVADREAQTWTGLYCFDFFFQVTLIIYHEQSAVANKL